MSTPLSALKPRNNPLTYLLEHPLFLHDFSGEKRLINQGNVLETTVLRETSVLADVVDTLAAPHANPKSHFHQVFS